MRKRKPVDTKFVTNINVDAYNENVQIVQRKQRHMTSYRLNEKHTIYEVRNDKRKRNNVRHMLMQLFACASFAVHRRHCFSRARELTRVFVLFLSEQFVQIGEFLANCRSWFRRHSPKSMYNYATRDHARTRRNFAECLLVCVQMNHMVERSCVPVSMKHFRM